jgi:4-amino-4-deoxy-L-arabinose transferase-like glycosyltransferase
MQRSVQAAPERGGLRRLAPPKSLAVLLVMVVVVGLAWALVVPPWQSPDEIAHFAYTQSLAESFRLPGIPGRPEESSDQSFAEVAVGAGLATFYPESAPPDWKRSNYAAYLAREHGADPPSKSNGGGGNPASSNPPLYYLFADVGYLIDHSGTAFGRLYAIRLSGVLLLGLTTLGAWLLAGETLGRRRLPQLACAAVAGLLPMSTFMSTAVNPDALLIALWTLALWVGARVINHRARGWDVVALCALTASAILTKATSYALVAPVLLALIIGWRRRPAPERGRALKPIAVAGAVLVVPVLGWLALAHSLGRAGINSIGPSSGASSSGASPPAHRVDIRQFLSYVWQFYLPRLPFLTPFRSTPQLPVYDIWVEQGAGTFGWLDVYLPQWLYTAAAIAGAGVGIAAVGLLSRLHIRKHLALLGFFALTLLALLVLLHASDYLSLINGDGQLVQGRYLLPVVGLLGLAVGLIVRAIPRPARPSACGLVITVLLAVQTISLAAVVQAYYL